jgi:hypothetical protein
MAVIAIFRVVTRLTSAELHHARNMATVHTQSLICLTEDFGLFRRYSTSHLQLTNT